MMNLYSGTTDPFSHRCRIVLFEKGMDFEVIDVDLYNKPEDIAVINPYNRVPVLVDRDLVLYESNIINEYIDERFPHPQLMPPDPIMRARARQLLHTFEHELFSHIEALEANQKGVDKTRTHVRDHLTQLAPIFTKQKFMLGEEFSAKVQALAARVEEAALTIEQGLEANAANLEKVRQLQTLLKSLAEPNT